MDLESEIEAVLRNASAAIDDPRREAALLAETARREPTADLARARGLSLAQERSTGRPLAYVVGHVTFMGVELDVAPGALVPRTETELLAAAAIEAVGAIDAMGAETRVIDMCCGSGNLACVIAARVPGCRIWASDLTPEAIAVARRNVDRLGLADRITLRQGDLFAAIDAGLQGTIDLVVCNPPYISTGRLSKDRAHLLHDEPREAFDGGPYGLTVHQRAVAQAVPFLRPGGSLLLEVGVGQHRQVALLFERSLAYEKAEERCDEEQRPRVVMARKKDLR